MRDYVKMASEHIVIRDDRKAVLKQIQERHRLKSLDETIDKLLGLYKQRYTRPKDLLIEELIAVQGKYHYVFNISEAELYTLFIALIRADLKPRVSIAGAILERVKYDEQRDSQRDKVIGDLCLELYGRSLLEAGTKELRAIRAEAERRYPELFTPYGVYSPPPAATSTGKVPAEEAP